MISPRALASTAIAVAVLGIAARASAQVARNVEPVVVTGAELPSWSRLAATMVCAPYPSGTTGGRDAHNGTTLVPPDVRTGVPVEQVVAFRWTGLAWVEIRVQVDERYFYCLFNPGSSFALYSGTDKELTYAWDVESWKKTAGTCTAAYPPLVVPTPDPVAGLDDDDEIAFMASDAGAQAPLAVLPPVGTSNGLAIAVVDPLDPLNPKFVYLFIRSGGSSFDASNGYVDYARDANADEWIDRYAIAADDPEVLGVSNTGYGPNLPGTVCRTASYAGYPATPDGSARASTDRFVRDGVTVTTDAYRWRATGRWMVRDIRVAKPGQPGVYGPDLIDRWKGRAFQQSPDSTISLVGFEDEQVNWEANSALLGERVGPVRAIRETWGADSGTNVTKTETFYRDAVTYRYHVRVHPIPPDGLYTSWDYNAGVATRYYNVLKPGGVAIDGVNDDVGQVDGVFGVPAFFDAPDPTFNVPTAFFNTEQIAGAGDAGSLVYIVEMKGATTLVNPAVVPYYRDDACLDDGTGDDPVARPWPGEASTDARVRAGYSAAAGGTPYAQLTCAQRQGAWGAHGIHYFVTGDSDNVASPEVLSEIDAQQWQFMVPTAAPVNVAQSYGATVLLPLQTVATPLGGVPSLLAPHAADASAVTPFETPVDVTLAGGDLLTCDLAFQVVTPPAHGTLSAIAGQACRPGLPSSDTARVTYTPAPGFRGNDVFTYRVNDGVFDSSPASAFLTVQPPPPPTCATGPLATCRRPVRAGKALLSVKDETVDLNDKLTWKWLAGAATSVDDFGDPLSTTSYQLCVYDGAGDTIARASAPAGGVCDGRPCWTSKGAKRSYRSRERGPNGRPRSSLKLTLAAGADGKAKILAKARGSHLGLDPLPWAQPVRVQLVNGEGECWEASYAAPATKNGVGKFVDRGE